MTQEELLHALTRLRRAQVRNRRAPHKPLLLVWLLGRFAATGSTAVTYAEAEAPVSTLINEFGPTVSSRTLTRERAAMPFVHLERELWSLTDRDGTPLDPHTRESGATLRSLGAQGRLHPHLEQLLATPATLAAATRLLLDQHFTTGLEALICDQVGLDLATLESAGYQPSAPSMPSTPSTPFRHRTRRAGFAEEVLRAYAYACAMCGFDGALGRNPVGLEAAHVRWHSQEGPDELPNGLALCTLHHTLLDLGVLGLTEELLIQVSGQYVARSEAGRAVDTLHGRRLARPRPGCPVVQGEFVRWHGRQVFKGPTVAAA
ncbi:phosphorothioated DNA-binding restriction endonuclease [Streptomyces apocyni]|uniref:phosphorothioated DNA-binding restriction endonuclease n=1 Tax=Streptomyces apocyni TaxID=2654677 RepID=UPI0012EA3E47|nr:HNH endonuclease [Streptomyces apocyni]